MLGTVRRALATRSDGGAPTRADIAAALPGEGRLLGDVGTRDLVDDLSREIVGAGPLEPLLRLPGVTDVLVHGPDEVYIDRGDGLERTEVVFADDAAVRRLAQRLAASAGRRLDDATPYVDARLADGVRLHAVLSPVSVRATALSLRVPGRSALPLSRFGPAAEILREIVQARLAFLVSGAAGSGKTTLLAALLGQVPPGERIVIVEDSQELAPAHPHVVQLEARPANLEGAGAITTSMLVRQALRMRPDRLVVGEVRGPEVVALLDALNTGHDGGCGTLHANAPADVPARIEALASGAGLDRSAVHSRLAAGVRVLIHVARHGRLRGPSEIAVLRRAGDGLVVSVPAVRFGFGGIGGTGGLDGSVERCDGFGQLREWLDRRSR